MSEVSESVITLKKFSFNENGVEPGEGTQKYEKEKWDRYSWRKGLGLQEALGKKS